MDEQQPEKKASLRDAMPETAEIVDELRQWLGVEVVDAAIAAGRRAQRQHAALAADLGQAAADAWLRRQRFPAGCFWAAEGGQEVGVRRCS